LEAPAPKRRNTKMPENLWKIMDEGGEGEKREETRKWMVVERDINLLGSYN
jgi:hypothetical protein